MNPLVEIGAIRVYASAFFVFRVFRGQTSDLLRIIRVNESRFQVRLIRVIRGLSRRSLGEGGLKNSVVAKFSRNFVPNFREPIAKTKQLPERENQNPNENNRYI